MRKWEKGYLTVEATLVLTTFLFFMMFVMNMGQVYRAQNYVTHGLTETGKMLSFASYEYGNKTTISELWDALKDLALFAGLPMDEQEIKKAWEGGNCAQAAKMAFGYCAGKNTESTNRYLKRYGLSNGIDTIDFSGTQKNNGNLYIRVTYTVDLPFAFFGIDSIDLHQQVVNGLWE